MDYAVNPNENTLHAQLVRWLVKPAPVKNATKWFLLDGALVEQSKLKQLIESQQYIAFNNAFIKSRFEVYGMHAPQLIYLDNAQPHTQATFVESLLALCNGVPALAALDACNDLISLRECLTWFGQAFTQDSMELYCRFADTRITPGLLQILDEDQKLRLGQNILQWQIVNRMGTLESLLPNIKPQLDNDPTPFNKFTSSKAFTLSDAQFAGLMEKAEVDHVFQMLLETNPELVPEKDRGLFYQRLSKNVKHAHQYGLTSASDLLFYNIVALSTHDKFDSHPLLEETWLSIKEKQTSFKELADSWSDDIWNNLHQAASA